MNILFQDGTLENVQDRNNTLLIYHVDNYDYMKFEEVCRYVVFVFLTIVYTLFEAPELLT